MLKVLYGIKSDGIFAISEFCDYTNNESVLSSLYLQMRISNVVETHRTKKKESLLELCSLGTVVKQFLHIVIKKKKKKIQMKIICEFTLI